MPQAHAFPWHARLLTTTWGRHVPPDAKRKKMDRQIPSPGMLHRVKVGTCCPSTHPVRNLLPIYPPVLYLVPVCLCNTTSHISIYPPTEMKEVIWGRCCIIKKCCDFLIQFLCSAYLWGNCWWMVPWFRMTVIVLAMPHLIMRVRIGCYQIPPAAEKLVFHTFIF